MQEANKISVCRNVQLHNCISKGRVELFWKYRVRVAYLQRWWTGNEVFEFYMVKTNTVDPETLHLLLHASS